MQKCQGPIHNCSLETFIWSIMWKILSFLSLKEFDFDNLCACHFSKESTILNYLFSKFKIYPGTTQFHFTFNVKTGHDLINYQGQTNRPSLTSTDFTGESLHCLVFEAYHNTFQHGGINNHIWAGRYVVSLRICQVKQESKLSVHNNINFPVLPLDPEYEMVRNRSKTSIQTE